MPFDIAILTESTTSRNCPVVTGVTGGIELMYVAGGGACRESLGSVVFVGPRLLIEGTCARDGDSTSSSSVED